MRVCAGQPLCEPKFELSSSSLSLNPSLSCCDKNISFRKNPLAEETVGGGLELIVQSDLDREAADHHDLRIVATDASSSSASGDGGGALVSRTGTLTVRVNVQDLNDNPPVFERQRYFAAVPADAAPGREVLRVRASDADEGANADVRYSVNRRQSGAEAAGLFRVEERTGAVRLDRRLPSPETGGRGVYEIVVVARDGGEVSQEASAFVTVRVTGASGGGSGTTGEIGQIYDDSGIDANKKYEGASSGKGRVMNLELKYLGGRRTLPENTEAGMAFAQVVSGDSSSIVDLDLVDSPDFHLLRNASGFFIATARQLDYEESSVLTLTLAARNPSDLSAGPVTRSFEVPVEDVNEHPPVFDSREYSAVLEEASDPGSLVTTVRASDADGGPEAGRISYGLLYDYGGGGSFADWFSVNEASGEVRTQTRLDCDEASDPRLTVVARDHGSPVAFTATATLSVSVLDVNDNAPVFSSAFYSAELSEDADPGECFLTVEATDLDCGANSEIRYRIKESGGADGFRIDEETGEVCLDRGLDRESQSTYGFTIIAADKGTAHRRFNFKLCCLT